MQIEWRQETEDKLGKGYNPQKFFHVLCDGLNSQPHTVCRLCGEDPHDGECNVFDVIRNDMHTTPLTGLN
jgi:hypothetical protein